MSLINKALKGSMILTMGDYAVYAFNIVAQLWLIRLLSPSQYGQYAIISAIVEFAYVLLTIEFATACIYYLDNEDIFHTAVILAWIWSVGMVVALYGLRYITTFWINEQNWVFASILVLLKFIYGISVVYGTYIERHLHFGKLTIVRSLAKLIALGCGIVIAKRGGGIKALVCIDMINYLLASLTIIAVSPLKVKLSSFRFDLAKLILKKGYKYAN